MSLFLCLFRRVSAEELNLVLKIQSQIKSTDRIKSEKFFSAHVRFMGLTEVKTFRTSNRAGH